MEDNPLRWPILEDIVQWHTTFEGRQPLIEYDLWLMVTFDWRKLPMEDDLWRKTFCDGIQLEDDINEEDFL